MTQARSGLRVDVAMLALRLVLGAAFVLHGIPKMQHPTTWGAAMLPGFPAWLIALAAIAEFVGGGALVLGVLTPLFAFMIACNMVVALFFVSIPHGAPFVRVGPGPSFELQAIYLASAFAILLVGPGRFALDALLFRKKSSRRERFR